MTRIFAPLFAIALISPVIPFAAAPALADDSTIPSVATTEPSSTQPSNDADVLSIDADTLHEAYHANEVRAASIYKDKLVAVKGVVRKITLSRDNRPVVFLGGQGPIPEVACVFNPGKDDPALDKIKALNVGDKVCIDGAVVDSAYGCVRIYAMSIDDPEDGK